MREIADYIKAMLSKDAPQSFGRSGCMFIIFFLVLAFCYIASKTATMPDVPPGWIALVTLLYSISKGGDALLKKVSGGLDVAKTEG
jgi:hypothetical protein